MAFTARSVVLKMKWVDAIRSGWTPDVGRVTNVHKTFITDHFIQSAWTTSTSIHARLHPCLPLTLYQHVNPECILFSALIDLPDYNILFCHSTQRNQRLMA